MLYRFAKSPCCVPPMSHHSRSSSRESGPVTWSRKASAARRVSRGGGRARPAGAPPGGAGLGLPPSFVDLLAGCHYRRAELLHDLGSRLESLQSYRRALDVWRGQFRRAGEPYRLTYAQVLGRVIFRVWPFSGFGLVR